MRWMPIESGGRCIYSVKPGSPIPSIRAQEIGEYIDDLEKTKPITPATLVQDAQRKNSKLHEFFEWNDAIAAERWRTNTARKIINHFEIAIVDLNTEEETTVRAWHSVSVKSDSGDEFNAEAVSGSDGKNATAISESLPARIFVGTMTAMSDDALRQQVLDNAIREIAGWQNRYKTYSELEPVFASIDEIQEMLN